MNLSIPVVIILNDNRFLGMVRQWQEMFYGKRYSEVMLGNEPDFLKLANSFDVEAERVEDPLELKGAIKRAIESNVPYLLDVIIEPEANVLPMVPPGGKIHEMLEG